MHTCIHAYMHTCIHAYIHISMLIYVCACVCVCVYMYVYTHIFTNYQSCVRYKLPFHMRKNLLLGKTYIICIRSKIEHNNI